MSGSENDGKPRRPAENAGGVRHDARGNAVWQWAVETGRHALDSTSRLLRRLEVPGLKIEDDAADVSKGSSAPAKPGDKPAMPVRSAGYDPYGGAGGGARGGKGAGSVAAPKAPRKPAAAAAPRRSLWQRLFRRD